MAQLNEIEPLKKAFEPLVKLFADLRAGADDKFTSPPVEEIFDMVSDVAAEFNFEVALVETPKSEKPPLIIMDLATEGKVPVFIMQLQTQPNAEGKRAVGDVGLSKLAFIHNGTRVTFPGKKGRPGCHPLAMVTPNVSTIGAYIFEDMPMPKEEGDEKIGFYHPKDEQTAGMPTRQIIMYRTTGAPAAAADLPVPAQDE